MTRLGLINSPVRRTARQTPGDRRCDPAGTRNGETTKEMQSTSSQRKTKAPSRSHPRSICLSLCVSLCVSLSLLCLSLFLSCPSLCLLHTETVVSSLRNACTHLSHAARREGVLEVEVLEDHPRYPVGLLAGAGPSERDGCDGLGKGETTTTTTTTLSNRFQEVCVGRLREVTRSVIVQEQGIKTTFFGRARVHVSISPVCTARLGIWHGVLPGIQTVSQPWLGSKCLSG